MIKVCIGLESELIGKITCPDALTRVSQRTFDMAYKSGCISVPYWHVALKSVRVHITRLSKYAGPEHTVPECMEGTAHINCKSGPI